ncbi:hypothetical protein GTH32_02750 [Alteromonas sp. 345S023]|uniref:NRDE family protein n=1 Tax=Alteromonas profundi TaxID=2696062 RepID=A0A7X5LIU0_9ALTE|nr:NRDE family protein [Alteromonas profundi]NDV90113.1 hypothetical protein [Alteromonas profundi]
MCILFIAHQQHYDYPLIIAANRDEFYERPTAPATFWDRHPHILAGKDLQAGGTWMGVTHNGAIAALTNIRAPQHNNEDAQTRGELVKQWLVQNPSHTMTNSCAWADKAIQPRSSTNTATMFPNSGSARSVNMFSKQLRQHRHLYNGYNLVFGYPHQLQVYNNYSDTLDTLAKGVFGLSNADINTSWPKVEQGTGALSEYVKNATNIAPEDLFAILRQDNKAPDHLLPQTGVPHEWEKALSSIFITIPTYGTRTSTLVLVDNYGKLRWLERTFNTQGKTTHTNTFSFNISP